MKNKGFTLVEMLAVISIIGVIAVLVIPTLLDVFNKSRKVLDEYTKELLVEAGEMYMIDLEKGIIEYDYTASSPYEIEGTTYKAGSKIKGYDLIAYAIESKGIVVSIKDLVKGGYFDADCDYLTKPKECKLKDTCKVKIKVEHDLVENGRYYVAKDYDVEILEGCE